MSSFYAELTVDGQTYPVRECQLGVSQATAGRGRVQTQVRPRLVRLTLDVPTTDALLLWAATPFKAQAGHVSFFQADRLTARETVSFAAGQCVSYRETFLAGDSRVGAYVCQLTVAAERLTISAGGPAGA